MFVKLLALLISNVLVSFGVLQVVKLHLGLMPSTLGLKTVRGALTANLSRVIIRTQRVPPKRPYLEL
jgi:predicted TIM-barrel fold metal-dependent hydrolase